MFGGRGTPPYEDDDQGMGGFRGEDSGAGDALAMGMDVDIPAASAAGDRREAERRRGRDSRYTIQSISTPSSFFALPFVLDGQATDCDDALHRGKPTNRQGNRSFSLLKR